MAKVQTLHPWIVIDAPDEFWIGRAFNIRDIKISARYRDWPNGIVFEHERTKRKLIYWDGRLSEINSLSESTSRLVVCRV